ncbi:MAG TPA: glycosyltransferase [Nitrososphaera sp.]|jgi:glycosyltransferase involved in cell wall biosynthesis|nr:glycosyltransferase [Nitrososphaera sp.]
MALAFTVVNLVFAAIMAGVSGVWVYFLVYMNKSFSQAPTLDSFDRSGATRSPLLSVILPARNEEKYIARCLDSLLSQDYDNFEIIAINDSSTDRTGEIIKKYAAKDSRVAFIEAPLKPEGWAGKNWACHKGYLQAKGEVLLFTDADTEHAPSAMSLAVGQLVSENLDALTAVPKLICNDFWTKITLPGLATFLHTRFSPLRVNDPNTRTGYFFGSFFIITRSTYEAVGTHQGVRQELVEDGALGGKVKEGRFRMKMVRGENQIEAVWARDLPTLWHGLRRLMISVYYQNKSGAYMMAAAVLFIMFVPFALLPYLPAASLANNISFHILFGLQLAAIALIIAATAVQCRRGVFQNPAYALASPLSGALISFGFLSAIAVARKKGAVSWRGRQYTISETQHPLR